MHFEEIDVHECYIRGVITLINDFTLHVAEYVVTAPDVTRPKYRYHLQDSEGASVSRWDNAPHHPEVSSFPHHIHDGDEVKSSPPVTIPDVLDVLLQVV
jgi:hypothetical protein